MPVDDRLNPARRLAIGAFTLAMAGAGFAGGRIVARPVERVAQPIAFDHRKHTKELELECSTCHEYYATAAHSGLPALETCLGCHGEALTDSPEEKKLLALAGQTPEPVFRKLFRLPDHVYYSHRRHVTDAGIACETCHGDIAATSVPPARPLRRITMDTCVDCHARKSVKTDCGNCHR